MICLWGVVDVGNVLWLGTKDVRQMLTRDPVKSKFDAINLRLTVPASAGGYATNPFGPPVSFEVAGGTLASDWKSAARKRAGDVQFRHQTSRANAGDIVTAIDQVSIENIVLDVYPHGFAVISAKLAGTPADPDMQAWIFEAFEYSFYVQPGSIIGNPVNKHIHRFVALIRDHLTLHEYGSLLARQGPENMPAGYIYCPGFSAVGEIANGGEVTNFKTPGQELETFELRNSTLYSGWWISFLQRGNTNVFDEGAVRILQYADLSWAVLKAFEKFFLEKFNNQAAASLHTQSAESEELSFDSLRALRMVSESVAICVDVETRANSTLVLKLLRHLAKVGSLQQMQGNIRYYSTVFADHMRNITKDAEDRHAKRLQAIAIWLTVASAIATCIALFQLLSETKLVLVEPSWSRKMPNSLVLLLIAFVTIALSSAVTWFFRVRR